MTPDAIRSPASSIVSRVTNLGLLIYVKTTTNKKTKNTETKKMGLNSCTSCFVQTVSAREERHVRERKSKAGPPVLASALCLDSWRRARAAQTRMDVAPPQTHPSRHARRGRPWHRWTAPAPRPRTPAKRLGPIQPRQLAKGERTEGGSRRRLEEPAWQRDARRQAGPNLQHPLYFPTRRSAPDALQRD